MKTVIKNGEMQEVPEGYEYYTSEDDEGNRIQKLRLKKKAKSKEKKKRKKSPTGRTGRTKSPKQRNNLAKYLNNSGTFGGVQENRGD